MTPQELIGRRIADARKRLPLFVEGQEPKPVDQVTLGRALERYLGKAWTKQAISEAERGHRVIDATELLAFAAVLGKPPQWFLTPNPGEQVEMPSGLVSDAASLGKVLEGENPDADLVLLAQKGLTHALEALRPVGWYAGEEE